MGDFKVPIWGKTVVISLYKKPAELEATDGNVTMYKIDSPVKGDCGEASCPASEAHFPIKFGGYKEGTCASVGYTVADGEKDFKVPIWGKTVVISLFKKPAELEATDGNVTMYKIDSPVKGDCGEASCPASEAHFPIKFGGYKEGTCASVGYTVADGEKDFKVPIWGKTVEIDLYKKPSAME